MTKVDKNFVARTKRKFEKLVRVDWISVQNRLNVALLGKVM